MGSTANFHRRLGSTLFFFLTLFSYKIGCTVLGFPTFSPVKLTYSANSIPLLCLIFQMPQSVSFWVLFFWQYIPIFLLQKLNDIHSLADLTHDFFKHIIPSLPSTFLLSVTLILLAFWNIFLLFIFTFFLWLSTLSVRK